MTGLFPVIAALLTGWGVWRRLGGGGPAAALLGSTVTGIAVTVVWMALLDVAGVRWSAGLLLAPLVPALALAVTAPRRPAAARRGGADRWAIGAGALVASRAAWIAAVPAFGWDFRFIWGVKARAFALAGGHDTGWLAWPGHDFAHPAYPPAWSDLVAAGVVMGASADAVAAAWQAVLAAALAAACWRLAAGSPSRVRALAAVAAACSPVLFDPVASGYAEPLIALLAAAALVAVGELPRGVPGSLPLLVLATGTLAATKNEGAVLAVALVAAAVVVAGPRRVFPAAAAVAAAVLAWQLVMPAGLIAADADMAPSLARASAHAAALPAALARAIARTPTIAVTLAAWLVWVVSCRSPALRGVRLAFGLWAVAVLGAYLSTTADLTWHLAASADRVLGAPLPAALALAAGAVFSAPPAAAAASAPASSRGAAPCA